jgi:hypothetical protein
MVMGLGRLLCAQQNWSKLCAGQTGHSPLLSRTVQTHKTECHKNSLIDAERFFGWLESWVKWFGLVWFGFWICGTLFIRRYYNVDYIIIKEMHS